MEPEEGKINWAILDRPAQRWITNGNTTATTALTVGNPTTVSHTLTLGTPAENSLRLHVLSG